MIFDKKKKIASRKKQDRGIVPIIFGLFMIFLSLKGFFTGSVSLPVSRAQLYELNKVDHPGVFALFLIIAALLGVGFLSIAVLKFTRKTPK